MRPLYLVLLGRTSGGTPSRQVVDHVACLGCFAFLGCCSPDNQFFLRQGRTDYTLCNTQKIAFMSRFATAWLRLVQRGQCFWMEPSDPQSSSRRTSRSRQQQHSRTLSISRGKRQGLCPAGRGVRWCAWMSLSAIAP